MGKSREKDDFTAENAEMDEEIELEKKALPRFELDATALLDVEEFLCDCAGISDIRIGYCSV